jgi:hypothetical protein
MHGSDRGSGPETDYERAWVGKEQTIHLSEMALFFEPMPECARKPLDTADIVRDAIFHQLTVWNDEVVFARTMRVLCATAAQSG